MRLIPCRRLRRSAAARADDSNRFRHLHSGQGQNRTADTKIFSSTSKRRWPSSAHLLGFEFASNIKPFSSGVVLLCSPLPSSSQVESLFISPHRGRYRFLRFELRELDRRQHAAARVRAAVVVIIAPGFDGRPRLGHAQEYMLVEAFVVAQAAVEGFGEGVLHGLARRHVVPVEPAERPAPPSWSARSRLPPTRAAVPAPPNHRPDAACSSDSTD
jgi:hypothetical protein